MRYIRDGHIKRKLECVKPFRFSVKNRGAKTGGTIFASVSVDDFGAPLEFLALIKEPAVMVQILNNDLKIALGYFVEQTRIDGIAFLWNDSKRGLDSKGVIYVHKIDATVPARRGFHVVRHGDAAIRARWRFSDGPRVYR